MSTIPEVTFSYSDEIQQLKQIPEIIGYPYETKLQLNYVKRRLIELPGTFGNLMVLFR